MGAVIKELFGDAGVVSRLNVDFFLFFSALTAVFLSAPRRRPSPLSKNTPFTPSFQSFSRKSEDDD